SARRTRPKAATMTPGAPASEASRRSGEYWRPCTGCDRISLHAGDERAERGATLRSAQHEIFAAVGQSSLFPDRDDPQPRALRFRTKQRLTRFIEAEHDNATGRKTPFHIREESLQGVVILIGHGSLQPILRSLA